MIKKNNQDSELNPNLVSNKYIEWMNNYEVTKLTEQRFLKHTKKNVTNFVKEKKKAKGIVTGLSKQLSALEFLLLSGGPSGLAVVRSSLDLRSSVSGLELQL